jgi:hypothetical protein
MIYLDPAAVVKLVHAEAESAALRGWLDERAETGWISSVLTEIESFRALARYAPDVVSRLPAVLDQIELISLDPPIRILALARDIGTPKEEADALDGIGRCTSKPAISRPEAPTCGRRWRSTGACGPRTSSASRKLLVTTASGEAASAQPDKDHCIFHAPARTRSEAARPAVWRSTVASLSSSYGMARAQNSSVN